MAIFPVQISATGKVITNLRRNLSKTANDEAQWTSSGNTGPWTVVFPPTDSVYNGSPFGSANSFTVPQNGNVKSGVPTVASGNTIYKYKVFDSGGNMTDDPDILVDP